MTKKTSPTPETVDGKPVLVTTAHRLVLFGYLVHRDDGAADGPTVTLRNARCAIRWSTTGGFLELAERGPNARSLIGARAPQIELRKVTSVTECTSRAVDAWESA